MNKFRDELYAKIVADHGEIDRQAFESTVDACSRKCLERAVDQVLSGVPLRYLFPVIKDLTEAFPDATVSEVNGVAIDAPRQSNYTSKKWPKKRNRNTP